MPRYMAFVRMEDGQGQPPASLFEAMDGYIAESAANGTFLDGGGLFGVDQALNLVVKDGEFTRVDGPYAEAKEVVGGWAIMNYESLEDAAEDQKRFAQLHIDHWPGVSFISTVRQIAE